MMLLGAMVYFDSAKSDNAGVGVVTLKDIPSKK